MDKQSVMVFQSPLGLIEITGNGKAVTGMRFCEEGEAEIRDSDDPVLVECMNQLQEYFQGNRETFDIPLDLKGTEFQKKVWDALMAIPYGKSTYYEEIAQNLGNIKASRAVGAAIGRNPVCILVPCHRVIGKDGSLTGFAWGLERKKWLRAHETRSPGKKDEIE